MNPFNNDEVADYAREAPADTAMTVLAAAAKQCPATDGTLQCRLDANHVTGHHFYYPSRAVINSGNRLSGSVHVTNPGEVVVTSIEGQPPYIKVGDGIYLTFPDNETLRRFTDVLMKAVYEC